MAEEVKENKVGTQAETVKAAIDELSSVVGKVKTAQAGTEYEYPIPEEVINELVDLVNVSREIIEPYCAVLKQKERKSLFGYGTKSYGFIEKSCAMAADHPQFLPLYLSVEKFQNNYGDVYRKRHLLQDIGLYEQQVDDSLRISSDAAYRDALAFYNTLKEAAKQGVEDAQELFDELKPYFYRPPRKDPDSYITDKD
ncbi:MAG: hypothetical protein LBS54_02995 [Dysgonamonadaceae bacterium]|jgi:hypothetical protein|nr:hypothetical protein [Dysgonamonadaceae bacterium]